MILDYIFHALRTLTGIYQQPFSKEWDATLNQILDHGRVVMRDDLSILIDLDGKSYDVWIGNKYYSYGYLYESSFAIMSKKLQYRPRFKTMLKLNDLCEMLKGK